LKNNRVTVAFNSIEWFDARKKRVPSELLAIDISNVLEEEWLKFVGCSCESLNCSGMRFGIWSISGNYMKVKKRGRRGDT
jgi:hypothetical protein